MRDGVHGCALLLSAALAATASADPVVDIAQPLGPGFDAPTANSHAAPSPPNAPEASPGDPEVALASVAAPTHAGPPVSLHHPADPDEIAKVLARSSEPPTIIRFIPEPASLGLAIAGLLLLALPRRTGPHEG